jgi:signal transduction histidine kinase
MSRIVFQAYGILASLLCGGAQGVAAGAAADYGRNVSNGVVTNIAQFRSVPPEVFLGRCTFRLDGVVTLVDSHRDLLVLQDETGAVALNPQAGVRAVGVQAGQRVLLEGSQCSPCVVGFPNYPYRPSRRDLWASFDVPADVGQYYLTRLRGYVHPPETGEYTFWIASDNSSELWLSPSDDPTRVKKIATLPRYGWVAPHEWSRYPSQRSETIHLKAGARYYIEAFQEQTTGGDHLAVAWQGPSVKQSVIANRFLSPRADDRDPGVAAATNGMLREYWTNFSLGTLATLTGPRTCASTLSVDEMRVTPRGEGVWPKPRAVTLQEQLQPTDNYPWVKVEGDVTFASEDGATGFLELSDGERRVHVRVPWSNAGALRRFRNSSVRIEGVCEGVYDPRGVLVPGLIWASKPAGISLIETAKAGPPSLAPDQSPRLNVTNSNPAMIGFYSTRGVVTFNGQVFGAHYLFVQEDTSVVLVSLKGRALGLEFEVGRWVELGGSLQAGKNIPTLSPLTVAELGWRSMPEPMTHPVQLPVPGSRDGRWSEVEGVVHAVNANGTVTLMGMGGPLSVWMGKASREALNRYVDAKLRVRGVLSLTTHESPLLLVPSAGFVDVEREAPHDPFAAPTRAISDWLMSDDEEAMTHRVKVAGYVTFTDAQSFFMQDASGGVRAQPAEGRELQIGQAVEVVGFPNANGSVRALTDALVRPANGVREVQPQKLDAGEGISFSHAGTLVQIRGNLIAQRTKDGRQVLELQEKQRVFESELPFAEQMDLPSFAPGSRLQLSGVCDFAAASPAPSGSVAAESPSTGALKIWLRGPADVVLLSGPPWWTWKHTATLVGALLAVLVVSLLRIHFLRHRLERQRAFSRQILESQESERRRIAANLHDSLGQILLVIKNQARLAMQPADNESGLRRRLDQISDCASRAIDEVREITHALRPYQLDRLGLTQAIRATVNRAAEHSSILFASHADDVDGLFDKESEIHVYRIVQEAVSNILQHSGASEAAVVVKKSGSAVSLSIRDNGRGFDAGAIRTNGSHHVGHGINGINERVHILGGALQMDSRPDQGTSLSIEIPVPVSKNEAA